MVLQNISNEWKHIKGFSLLLSFFCISCFARGEGEKEKASKEDVLIVSESFKKDRPNFELITIKVGSIQFQVEYANSPYKRQIGLMFVEKMPKNQGMLFHFDREQRMSFWMKNTLIPLDIAFFSKEGKLLEVQSLDPAPSLLSSNIPRADSKDLGLYTLEMNKGWFEENGLKPGVQLKVLKK